GGLQRLVTRRINIVPAADRELLHFAAVAGKVIDPRLLAEAFPDRAIDSWITTCVNASLLTFDDERLHFTHQKIREGILVTLEPEQRRQLHGQVAQALGQAYPDFMLYAAQLAHHWYESGDGAKAALYAAIAGDQALRIGVYTEARQLYELAIDALSQLPPAIENHEQLIDTTVRLGRIAALMPSDKLPDYLQRALDAATELGDETRLAAVYGSIGTFHYVAGRIPQAFNYFGRALVLGEKLGLERLLLQPYNMMGRALCAVGKFRQASDMLYDGIELARALDENLLLASSLPYYAATFAFLGNYEGSRPHANEALARARAMGHQSQLAATLVTLGHYHTFCGQFEKAIDYLQEVLLMRNDLLRPQVRYEAHGCLGYIHFHFGEHEIAFEHLNICLQLAAQTNELTTYLPIFQSVMAELMLESGEREGALQLAEEALLLAEKTQQPMAQGLVRQTMAKILMKAPDPNWLLCIELLEQTRLLFEQDHILPLAAITAFELGKLYSGKGDRLVAQQYIGHAEQAFATMEMSWHRAKAKLFAA
ncbi:MAG: tetratricopeptide repeat protein, partial [Anaerolineales bacterium]|nr:tetratricopeptide repeat protein [Anaerolineales bacterium]